MAVITGTTGNDAALTGTTANDTIDGLAGNDVINGGGGFDYLIGGDGDDTVTGGTGNDTLDGGLGADSITGGGGTDTIFGGDGNDTIAGSNVNDTINAGAGDDSITGSGGTDSIIGGDGADTITGGDANDTIDGGAGNDSIDGNGGTDSILGGAGTDTITTTTGNDTIDGGTEADTIDGGAGNNSIIGGDGADTITTTTGNDTIDGGAGADTITGGNGANSIAGGTEADTITTGTGNDTIDGGAGGDIIMAGAGANLVAGGADNDAITTGADNDTIDGGAGVDTMTGGSGDDIYYVDSTDTVTEATSGGTDTIIASVSAALSADVENLTLKTGATTGTGNDLANLIDATALAVATTLTGNAGADTIKGGSGADSILGGNDNDSLLGGAGNDSIDGGTGIDAMIGGTGDDTYGVENTLDVITEAASEGIDTVRAFIDYTLSDNLENLVLLTGATKGTGNTGNNLIDATALAVATTLDGAAGNDTIKGGTGTNSMLGGDGNDSLVGNTANDNLSGGAGNDILEAGAGNDNLDGGTGNDNMTGGAGDDAYVVDATGDVITEATAAGIDAVLSSIDYTLGANLENLTLKSGATKGTGNASDNIIKLDSGNTAAVTLDGAAGADTLTGASGADLLLGGDGSDSLVGNAGNDILNGGAGTDDMTGGAGDDSYYVDSPTDRITEAANEGWDVVYSTVDHTLGGELESLYLQGTTGLKGTGNAINNSIFGTSAADSIDGKAGKDLMRGGAGDDTYTVDDVGDVVDETGSSTKDVVQIDAVALTSYALGNYIYELDGSKNTSAALLTGNSLSNSIKGSDLADSLNGGGGSDTLAGAGGDDVYYVYNLTTTVTEAAGKGTDTVYTTANGYILAAEVENAVLVSGSVLYGNTGINTLTGNADGNFLVGGAGADNLIGGKGNDTYAVDDAADVITEGVGEGAADLIYTVVTHTLETNVEHLVMMGVANIAVTGNDLSNGLWGNSGANTLTGGDGKDLLGGLTGADSIILTEGTQVTDIVRYYEGDSNATAGGYDTITSFALANGTSTSTVDALDLPHARIAANAVLVNGVDVGTIRSHAVSNGLLNFSSSDTLNVNVAVTSANLTDALNYLQNNIAVGDTVAFLYDANGNGTLDAATDGTFVFQGGVTTDIAVQLLGVQATGLSNTGLVAGTVAFYTSSGSW